MYAPAAYIKTSAWEFFAASAYFQNWNLYASATNYFAQDSIASPYRHYWSLSVEEQFYLLWPLLFLLLFATAQKIRKVLGGNTKFRTLIIFFSISVFITCSLGLATYQVQLGNNGAYFSTFTRMWEFLVGALVAFLVPPPSPVISAARTFQAQLARNTLQILCYFFLVASLFIYTETSGVPGLATILPVISTAGIILLGPVTYAPWLRTLVDAKPTQFWGDISYSLYLWHWPFIVLLPFIVNRELRWWEPLLLLPVLAVLSFLTKKLIEDPFRPGILWFKKPSFTFAGVGLSVLLVFASSLHFTSYADQVIAQQQEQNKAEIEQSIAQAPAQDKGDKAQRPAGCVGALAIYNLQDCKAQLDIAPKISAGAENEDFSTYSDDVCIVQETYKISYGGAFTHTNCDYSVQGKDTKNVWVLGDSHAEQWKAAIATLSSNQKWKTTFYTHSGCPIWNAPYLKVRSGSKTTDVPETTTSICSAWSQQVVSAISQARPDVLVLASYSSIQLLSDSTVQNQEQQYKVAMEKQVKQWQDMGIQVVVMHDTPIADDFLGPGCVTVSGQACTAKNDEVLVKDPQFEAAKSLKISTIDMTDYFCQEGICRGVIGGIPVFYDTDHISLSYSKTLAYPLQEKLLAIVGG